MTIVSSGTSGLGFGSLYNNSKSGFGARSDRGLTPTAVHVAKSAALGPGQYHAMHPIVDCMSSGTFDRFRVSMPSSSSPTNASASATANATFPVSHMFPTSPTAGSGSYGGSRPARPASTYSVRSSNNFNSTHQSTKTIKSPRSTKLLDHHRHKNMDKNGFSQTAMRFPAGRYDTAVPGPGNYDFVSTQTLTGELDKKNKITPKKQHFGVTEERFAFTGDRKIEVPGPGFYAKDLDTPQSVTEGLSSEFKSPLPRLPVQYRETKNGQTPGPGSYVGVEEHFSMSNVDDNKFRSLFTPCGKNRGWHPSQKEKGLDANPALGPGVYSTPQVETQFAIRASTSCAESALKSETPRFSTSYGSHKPVSYWNVTPGPGTYPLNAKSFFSDTSTFG